MINSTSWLEVMANARQRAMNWKQFEKWRKSGEYRVHIGQEEKRMANMLQNVFNTLPTLPPHIFNNQKPNRSLPMWISKEKLEQLIDERVAIIINKEIGQRSVDKYIIKGTHYPVFINYEEVEQNKIINMIMDYIGIKIVVNPSQPREVKLVKKTKDKKTK
jgi:hypothetical protein